MDNILQCASCTFQDLYSCRRGEKPSSVLASMEECVNYKPKESVEVVLYKQYDNSFYGALAGFVIGDALGVPVEFKSRDSLAEKPVTGMRGYGTHYQPMGTWSDDTSLMLAFIDAWCRGFSMDLFKQNLVEYHLNGKFTPYGDVFDIGNTTLKAIDNILDGKKDTGCTGEQDNGNGSLMRILPLGIIWNRYSDKYMTALVESVSAVTHAHIKSKIASVCYAYMVKCLFGGMDREDAYDATVQFISSVYEDNLEGYERILNKSLLNADVNEIKSTGYVIDTLEAVIWCFLQGENYRDTVLRAVNLGGDTDTIAALTGGLAGAWYGFVNLPEVWIQVLAQKRELFDTFHSFLRILR